MKKIDVCFTPDQLALHSLKKKRVVVVDILRATSSITAGIAAGVPYIRTETNIEKCLSWKHDGYLVAGERNGRKLPGAQLGNSPFEFIKAAAFERPIAMTTTNGTIAIRKSEGAEEILIGSFLNLSMLSDYLANSLAQDILVVCSGWKGTFSMEDTLFAGALVYELQGVAMPTTDAANAALQLFVQQRESLHSALSQTAHAIRLGDTVAEDIKLCATIDKHPVLPVVEQGVIRKMIET
jgi:2-phosphosulfolactate phosphatase